ncbi:predicted protein [Lichtheimia corymbifera JMRC:FSU:9682]|uniref:Uncharacterized protein n=1 Tax=Lichtheimia corymbifera JMRC:FSU:9682 TaxID=1263082 RepID=A0A068SC56_9FUNG|nr:predicted protein [Lichtheimia corymbifera JMRC:FSU:9682]CDH59963.1 predicted protein [Lichtheimia corymbifera JMRC:FSU:9682]
MEKEGITGVLCINVLDLHWLWMDGWMQSSTVVDYFVCRQRKDGSCCVDAAEDDDGLDGMDETACIFDKCEFAAMDDIGCWRQGTHSS